MTSDPIADMLTRIRNATIAHHDDVAIPYSAVKEQVAALLVREGFLEEFDVAGEVPQKLINVRLKRKTPQGRALNGLKRVSKPGRRVYAGKNDVPRVLGGLGVSIISTSRGIMSGRDAHNQGIGGEVVAFVW